ncbi:MAG: aldehyde dehydrogenase family protein [Corynebacteriales bacterium]|nr:aldehyde dehydrogenase family protein [Mycobacteriales bacterium]
MSEPRPFWLAGRPVVSGETFSVFHPYDGRQVTTVSLATPDHVEAAIVAAQKAAPAFAATSAAARAAALDYVVTHLRRRAEEIAQTITDESGKPIKWARIEVTRAISTFRWAAEEARRFSGQLQRLDTDQSTPGRIAMVRRFPRGPILGITPFNFPLNLVAHKVAPALAVGAPIIVKPAPRTPLSALILGEILSETELPAGAVSVLTVPNEHASELAADPRIPVVSFTGSVPIGWQIKEAVPHKHVALELGGNAAVIVAEDYKDLDYAAERIATFANYQAGQSCISVQRVYIADALFAELRDRIVSAVEKLRTGDPREEETDVGPMIDEKAAIRAEQWIAEADADVLIGGQREGTTLAPTVITGAAPAAKVNSEEVFAPVVTLTPFRDIEQAFELVNASKFGLQAGIFTHDTRTAFAAHAALNVGGVIVGDVPSYRADQAPYGGVKASGVGREGVASAMDDYTEPRTMVLTGVAL